MKKLKIVSGLFVFILVGMFLNLLPMKVLASDFPPIWNIPTNTGEIHGIIVNMSANPRINNIPIEAGDFIGGFYTDENGNKKCGGADYWQGGTANIIFPLFMDNLDTSPTKEGFSYGENIEFRIFSWRTGKEYVVSNINFDTQNYPSSNKWYPLGLSSVTNMQATVSFDAYAVASPSSVCAGNGDTVSLTAMVQDPPFSGYAPGDSPYDYSWFIGNTPSGNNSTFVTDIVNSVTDGFSKYFLKGEDNDGLVSPKSPVVFDVNTQPVVGVSANTNTVCVGYGYSYINLNSSVSGDYGNISWTSSDPLGTFTPSNNNRDPKYYYGSTPGVKNITLTAQPKIANVCSPASASLALNVLPNATVNAGADTSLCVSAGTPINISATVYDYISNPNSFIWTGGTGTFGNNQSPTTTYTPSSSDIALGYVTLKACAKSQAPCSQTPICDQVVYSFTQGPTGSMPTTLTMCENQTKQVGGAFYNYNNLEFTSSGNGTFTPLNPPNPNKRNYTPSDQEKLAGSSTVTVTASSNTCPNNSLSKQTQVTIVKLPTVNAGPDINSTGGTLINLSATATNYSSVSWTKSGTGTMTGTYTLTPTYTPSQADINAGSVTLTIKAIALSTCGYVFVTDQVVINLQPGSVPPPPTPPNATPTVTTNGVSSITQTGVTFNGSVSDLGGATSVSRGFQYGITTNYSNGIPPTTGGTGSFYGSITNGLTCNTTYHYRAYASNSAGVNYGADMTFTTSACSTNTLPSVTTNSYTLTSTGATFNGTIDNPGVPPYYQRGFKYSKSEGTETTISVSGTGTAFSKDLTLDCGSTYSYRAYVTNSVGTDEGDSITFQTSACPTGMSEPTVTTSGYVISGANVFLTGSVTNDGGGAIIQKGFEFGTTQDYGTIHIATSTGQLIQKSIPLLSLMCGTTYHYIAFARNADYTGYGVDKQFTTNSCQAFLNGNMMLGNALSGYNSAKMLLATSIIPNGDMITPGMELNQNYNKQYPSINFKRTLKMEMTGDDILALQKFLNTHGYVLATTGPGSQGNETNKFGKLMRSAVMKFQKAYGLTVDGIVGPKMIAKINELQ